MEPAAKRQRLEEAEEDAASDKSARIKQLPAFHVEDTTMRLGAAVRHLRELADGVKQGFPMAYVNAIKYRW